MHGNTISEAEFRDRILRAVATVTRNGLPVTFATLKGAGLRGSDRRVRDTVEIMRREGLIGPYILVANRRMERTAARPAPTGDLPASPAATGDDPDIEARERSAEWVAEHDARWRRIRRIGKGQPCGS